MKNRMHAAALLGVATTAFSVCSAYSLLWPALAFAAEEGEGVSGIALLLPPIGEFIPMLIAFIILWVILARFAWPVFMRMIDTRAEKIKDSMEAAEKAKIESEKLLEQQRAELAQAKKDAAEIIASAKLAAESVREEITAGAREEAEAMVAKARGAIEAEKKIALAELQSTAADMTVSVAQRVIGTDLSDVEHKNIIERYLAEAGSFNDN